MMCSYALHITHYFYSNVYTFRFLWEKDSHETAEITLIYSQILNAVKLLHLEDVHFSSTLSEELAIS